ncbi:hypothetical protein [Streptomyces sp. TLI_146]|uniref:hypothetical protein n=1 Tax=Streptomyces sp. TLI_146 TaxID=1938858 RepID=UPI000CB9751A|nr:hypothetical protein [Streptomyces sp. TLI_146]PKV86844.1 hypothetical protein BX283_4416 [Streptomyces sp. TLI_146]
MPNARGRRALRMGWGAAAESALERVAERVAEPVAEAIVGTVRESAASTFGVREEWVA